MRFSSQRGRRRLLTFLVASMVALMTFAGGIGSGGVGTPVAHAAALRPLDSCSSYTTYYNYFTDVDVAIKAVTGCAGSPPGGTGWLYPCYGAIATLNMDAWLSKSTQPGGTRLAESGRSGEQSWAPDCQWHAQVNVTGWGQLFTVPLWACLWAYDRYDDSSVDWLCAQDY